MSSDVAIATRRDVAVPDRPIDVDELISRLEGEERRIIVDALWSHGSVKGAAYALGMREGILYERMKVLEIRDLRSQMKMLLNVAGKTKNRLPKLAIPPTKMPRLKSFVPIKCLCCGQSVNVPDIELIIDYYKIPRCEQRVLRAVWKGKGRPVQTERIFDSMYLDDPDGGPSPDAMYRAFKALMHNIRCRLVGSGITIESVGYRQGYRIVIGDGSNG